MKDGDLAEKLGLSRQMIGKLRKQGMPVSSLSEAIEWRDKNLHPFRTKQGRLCGNSGVKKQQSKPQEYPHDIEEMLQEVNGAQLDLDSPDADILFKNARALKEKALALQAAAEHEKFMSNLVEREQVERVIFVRGRQFRDGLMSLSRRLAPEIVGCHTIPEAESLLYSEFKDILEAFSKLPVIKE